MSKVFTLEDVAKHNSKEDCWLIIGGKGGLPPVTKRSRVQAPASAHLCGEGCWLFSLPQTPQCGSLWVYDVTKFLDDHPGGDDVLLSSTGKDATDDFEDVGHSNTARAMMDEYLVGEIDASTIPSRTKYVPPKQPHYNQDKTPEFVIKILQFLVPLAILGLAVAVRMYTKSESA